MAVGHSLGGAIIDQFLKLKLVNSGYSYNPAIQQKDKHLKLRHYRIYHENDPILVSGLAADNIDEKREKPAKIGFAAHSIEAFKGGKKIKQTKKDLIILRRTIGKSHLAEKKPLHPEIVAPPPEVRNEPIFQPPQKAQKVAAADKNGRGKADRKNSPPDPLRHLRAEISH
jgi:hypothetical protein